MWYFDNKEFTDENIPEGAFGFIYAIKITIDEVQYVYIGKKQFYSNRTVKKGKKELAAMTDKRGSKKRTVQKLDYKNYCSSNAKIKEAVKSGIKVKRFILKICYSKMELTYQETRYLFQLDVLENKTYLNDNILGRFYRSKLNKTKDE
jgi:ABC-type ATPase involved in cell division